MTFWHVALVYYEYDQCKCAVQGGAACNENLKYLEKGECHGAGPFCAVVCLFGIIT